MARAVEVTAEGIAFHLRYQQYNEPELILNLISHGPMEKCLDMTCGGAMYYNLCIYVYKRHHYTMDLNNNLWSAAMLDAGLRSSR